MNKEDPKVQKAIYARRRLMLCADTFEMAIVNDLPHALMGRPLRQELKMRVNRIKKEIDEITSVLGREIMAGEQSMEKAKDFAYPMYTLINCLSSWAEDDLYDLVKQLNKKGPGYVTQSNNTK